MKRLPVITKDGSMSVEVPGLQVMYHSKHGAVTESRKVFIEAGLEHRLQQRFDAPLKVFEMGLGTALNALLTYIEAESRSVAIDYTAVEAYPLDENVVAALNYPSSLGRNDLEPVLQKMHRCPPGENLPLSGHFSFLKLHNTLQEVLKGTLAFDLVYFDAFAPASQPELWTQEIFSALFGKMNPGGVLVTYCSKGDVRRAMKAAGFTVEKLPGPPGKREMLRARV